jgi:hypothetical protein
MQHTEDEVRAWGHGQVNTWIASLTGSNGVQLGVNGAALLEVNDENLLGLGVNDSSVRERIVTCIAAIKDPSHTSGRYGCEYDCGFTSDDFDAVDAHEQVSDHFLDCIFA